MVVGNNDNDPQSAMQQESSGSAKKKKKGVRMNVGFGDEVEDEPKYRVNVQEHVDERANDNTYIGEIDPELMMVATVFVDELIQRAQIVADERFSSRKTEPVHDEEGNEEVPFLRRLHPGFSARGGHGNQDNLDQNLRFIREEINKRCRRVYQAFLSCYGKLP